jgi:hypothetical protein
MQEDVKKITEEISLKLKEIKKRKNMVRGSINKIYKRCGNMNCKCAKGEKHEEYRLTYKGSDQISKTVYLSKNKIKKVQKMVDNYKEAKLLFNEILELNVKLIKLG